MIKGRYIAIGFIPTIIALYILVLLSGLISHDYFYRYFIFISLPICLPTAIFIKKRGYKNIGTGIIAALISFHLLLLLLFWMMQAPM